MKTLTYSVFKREYQEPTTEAEYWQFVAKEMALPDIAYIGFPSEGKRKRVPKPKLCAKCKGDCKS